MNEQLQWLADRYIRLAERLALLEANSAQAVASNRISGNTLVPEYSCLVLDNLEILSGYSLELASGAVLVLVG